MTAASKTQAPARAASQLVAEITCPNCWHRFPPEQLLFISRHESLLGDMIVGPQAFRRFRPSRFTVEGDAIDARGLTCQDLACCRCHLPLARPLVEMLPFYCSIAGAPASGKSYFLATMTWMLRQQARLFGLQMAESDPTANHELQRYEEALFLSANPDQPVEIRKTETGGTQLYQTVNLDGQPQTLPRPFVFTLRPLASKHNGQEITDGRRMRALVIYDNAGEHFLPGQDSTDLPVTLHLARASAMFFMFDPTQDPRFRARCRSEDPQLKFGIRAGSNVHLLRQELVLSEMANRVRRYAGLSQRERHHKPLFVVLAKADIWANLIDLDIDHEPYIPGNSDNEPATVDLDRLAKVSEACRDLMHELCPEIASAAEAFASNVHYVPVSSLGRSPELVEEGERQFYGIRPSKIQPKWVTVPLLWAMAQQHSSLLTPTPGSPGSAPTPGTAPGTAPGSPGSTPETGPGSSPDYPDSPVGPEG